MVSWYVSSINYSRYVQSDMERERYQNQIKELLQAVETLLKSNTAMGERVAQLEKIVEDYEDLKAENAKLKGDRKSVV